MKDMIGAVFFIFGFTTAIRETWTLSKPPNSWNEIIAKHLWIVVGSIIGIAGMKILKFM